MLHYISKVTRKVTIFIVTVINEKKKENVTSNQFITYLKK